jgi:hypothetical protein
MLRQSAVDSRIPAISHSIDRFDCIECGVCVRKFRAYALDLGRNGAIVEDDIGSRHQLVSISDMAGMER